MATKTKRKRVAKTAATASDFHEIVAHGSVMFLVPRTGFPLNRSLDDFLAFATRSYPLASYDVVAAASVVDVDDLDRAHRALHDFLERLGYRVPDALGAKIDDLTAPYALRWVMVGDNKHERLAALQEVDAGLREIIKALKALEPPSIALRLRHDDEGRRTLHELVLTFLRCAVASLPRDRADLDRRGVNILRMLEHVPQVPWPPAAVAKAKALEAQFPPPEPTLISRRPGAWW